MYNYPLNLSFKLVAVNPQVKVTDAAGQTVLYVKEKAFSLKMNTSVFADEAQQRKLYQITADKIMGLTIPFTLTDGMGGPVGKVIRPGARSIWKATYQIQDAGGAEVGLIHEENPWLRVLEGFVSEVPFVNMFINPAYLVDLRGQTVLYLKKEAAMLEGKFTLDKRGSLSEADERLLIPAVMTMLMLERMRG